jgi:hypothetical protein
MDFLKGLCGPENTSRKKIPAAEAAGISGNVQITAS